MMGPEQLRRDLHDEHGHVVLALSVAEIDDVLYRCASTRVAVLV